MLLKQLPVNAIDLNVNRYVHKLLEGQAIMLASMHGKEKVIDPIISKFLPVKIKVCAELNTDQFGTFSGEVTRESPITALKAKNRSACRISGAAMAIASEGSFGSHPLYSFLPVNEEFVMLTNESRGWEVIGRNMTTETNYNSSLVNDWEKLYEFALSAGFPSHGIILRSGYGVSYKDICTWDTLKNQFTQLANSGEQLEVFTDMRAMRNPTRMRSIALATESLITNLFSLCPNCMLPGFSVDQSVPGLPCAECESPTKITKGFMQSCRSCAYSCYQRDFSTEYADPKFCDYCNP